MKFLKRSLLAVLCLGMALTGVACGNKGDKDSSTGGGASSGGGTSVSTPATTEQKVTYLGAIKTAFTNAKSFKASLDFDFAVSSIDAKNAENYYKMNSSIDADLILTEKTVGTDTTYEMQLNFEVASSNEDVHNDSSYKDNFTSVGSAYVVDNYIYGVMEQNDNGTKYTFHDKVKESVPELIEYVMTNVGLTEEIVAAYVAQVEAVFGNGDIQSFFVDNVKATVENGTLMVGFDAAAKANEYFKLLGSNATVSAIANKALSEINKDLTAESIVAKLKTAGNKKVHEFVAEVDAWLTEEYETTIQAVYNKLMADADIVASIKNMMLVQGMPEADATEMIDTIKAFQIASVVGPESQYGQVTVDQLIAEMTYDDNGTPDDDTDDSPAMTAAQIATILENALKQNFEAISSKSVVLGFANTSFTECGASVGAKFDKNNAIENITLKAGFNLKTVNISGIGASDREPVYSVSANNTATGSLVVVISELSAQPVTITLPTLPAGQEWDVDSLLPPPPAVDENYGEY